MSASQRPFETGAYGCVYHPPLECKDNSCEGNKCKTGVSKYMYGKDIDAELKTIDDIDRLDPYLKYHIGKPHRCIPKTRPIGCSKVIENPNFYRYHGEPAILIFDHAGNTLHRYIEKHPEDFVELFRQLFEILSELSKLEFVHFDIKGNNIMVDKNKRVKLIDFGFSWWRTMKLGSYHNPKDIPNYIVWPHEAKVLIDIKDNYSERAFLQNLEYIKKKHADTYNFLFKMLKSEGVKYTKKYMIERIDIYAVGGMYKLLKNFLTDLEVIRKMDFITERYINPKDYAERKSATEVYDIFNKAFPPKVLELTSYKYIPRDESRESEWVDRRILK